LAEKSVGFGVIKRNHVFHVFSPSFSDSWYYGFSMNKPIFILMEPISHFKKQSMSMFERKRSHFYLSPICSGSFEANDDSVYNPEKSQRGFICTDEIIGF
ncbi:hypothetical protein, partial [Thermoactinomyces intermedius]|uniref:hypothetical protein n=1 Tax=Thermoactinomyces intermedius TaxID=2024 RepID=UPI001C6992FA